MMPEQPTQQQLDEMRTTGYRPTAVCCLLNSKRVLFLFKKEYRLWLLPQCGIGTNEQALDVIFAELKKSMGDAFVKSCDKSLIYLGDEQVEFLPEKQTGEELITADGRAFKMLGKHYYFYAVNVSKEDFDLAKTEFDEYYWFTSKPALSLASKIYQPGKRRTTMKATALLKEAGLID